MYLFISITVCLTLEPRIRRKPDGLTDDSSRVGTVPRVAGAGLLKLLLFVQPWCSCCLSSLSSHRSAGGEGGGSFGRSKNEATALVVFAFAAKTASFGTQTGLWLSFSAAQAGGGVRKAP